MRGHAKELKTRRLIITERGGENEQQISLYASITPFKPEKKKEMRRRNKQCNNKESHAGGRREGAD